MAQKRLPMRKARKILFDETRSARSIATHCDLLINSIQDTIATEHEEVGADVR